MEFLLILLQFKLDENNPSLFVDNVVDVGVNDDANCRRDCRSIVFEVDIPNVELSIIFANGLFFM